MMGRKMCGLHKLAVFLVIVGALNWGLIGVANFNFVTFIFGNNWATTLIYILVGISGLAMLTARRCCLGGCKGSANCPNGACPSGNCCCQPGASKQETPPAPLPDKK